MKSRRTIERFPISPIGLIFSMAHLEPRRTIFRNWRCVRKICNSNWVSKVNSRRVPMTLIPETHESLLLPIGYRMARRKGLQDSDAEATLLTPAISNK